MKAILASFAAVCLLVGGCAALTRAAPTLIDATAQVLAVELRDAQDDEQRATVREALAILDEVRQQKSLAEAAAARAEAAAQRGTVAANLAEVHAEEAAAWARYTGARLRLARALRVALRPATATLDAGLPADAALDGEVQ